MNPLREVLEQNKTTLIADARAYAHKVLMQHKPYPWHDPTLYSNYMKQVASLLQVDVLVLRFDKMLEEELKNNAELVAKMGEKKRQGYALKVFMQDEGMKEGTSSLVNTATNTLHVHILTQLPSPLRLLQMSAQAVGSNADFSDEDIENASMYYADWLRSYKDSKVRGLLFDERTQKVKESLYQPILNTANNYHWEIGFRRADALHFCGFDAPIPTLDTNFWLDKKAPSPQFAHPFFTEIHEDAIPEVVLEKLHAFFHL
ncbi:hypothetical protein NHP190003_15500 [Helicobacter sp. NHP19-003]|uniref:Uncharacterized protein n=1 Tax=Helicobacter gastrocanis TaxID=2849641 RepID=A0ABN6I860_9HELI|nr:hypothetical protein [Helicobacter sp. NHP19-003]BCZ18268.1 hypothetical protein NHP190003_15500 [Helicobacter sp. NHP19-003]